MSTTALTAARLTGRSLSQHSQHLLSRRKLSLLVVTMTIGVCRAPAAADAVAKERSPARRSRAKHRRRGRVVSQVVADYSEDGWQDMQSSDTDQDGLVDTA